MENTSNAGCPLYHTGNRIAQTDARGVTTQFSYDALNRLQGIIYPDPTQNVTLTYDTCTNGIGRLCAMTDASGTTDDAYDARGNLVTQTSTRDGISRTIGYAYDNADQLIQITYPDGRSVDYQRNVNGQIDTVTTTLGGNTVTLANNLSYEPFGPLAALSYGNGIGRTLSYDVDYRLIGIQDTGTATVLDRSYTLDQADNISAITDYQDANRSQGFGYDVLNRLTAATGVYGTLDYSYDANGNRLSETHDSNLKTYTYDTASHHLLQTDDGGTIDYSYDANGNTVDNSAQQFSYGDNNRLKEVSINTLPLATYTYNGKGERVKKDDGTLTYYHYDQAGQLIAETDALGNTIREYVYLNGQPLALISNGSIYTIHTDHLGTPQLITDQNQNIVWDATYTPFGTANIVTETVTNNLRAPGQYWDAETGLHHNGFRTYDPSTGRYIQSDPIGLIAGLNTYLYVGANPIIYFDFLGLCKCIAKGNNGAGDKDSHYIDKWYGSRRVITCTYECTKDDGAKESVTGTHTEWYLHSRENDVGNEGDCLGAVFASRFSSYKLREIYFRTHFESFDPEGSDSPELKKWAEENCDDC